MNDINICPVCKKEFKLTDKHMYQINTERTCSWKCFLKGYEQLTGVYPKLTKEVEEKAKQHKLATEISAEKKEDKIIINQTIKRKRGRPKKNP